jgi:hypothetical protein
MITHLLKETVGTNFHYDILGLKFYAMYKMAFFRVAFEFYMQGPPQFGPFLIRNNFVSRQGLSNKA